MVERAATFRVNILAQHQNFISHHNTCEFDIKVMETKLQWILTTRLYSVDYSRKFYMSCFCHDN